MRKLFTPSLTLWFLLALAVVLPTGCGHGNVGPTTQFIASGGGDATGIEGTLPKVRCAPQGGISASIGSLTGSTFSANVSNGRESRFVKGVVLSTSASAFQYTGDKFSLSVSATTDSSGKHPSHVTATISEKVVVDANLLCDKF